MAAGLERIIIIGKKKKCIAKMKLAKSAGCARGSGLLYKDIC